MREPTGSSLTGFPGNQNSVAGRIFVGTSGWNYCHWSDGRVLPGLVRVGRKDAYIFNNDAEAYAVKNAQKLMGMIEARYVVLRGVEANPH